MEVATMTNQQIKGEIGYYNLGDWWLSTFTQEEQDHIIKTYSPMSISMGGNTQSSNSLTEGEIDYMSGTAAGLLSALAGWFDNARDREIAKKIIAKAEELGSSGEDILDQHFALAEKMTIYYRDRDNDPTALGKAIHAAKDQIALAPQAAKAFIEEYPEDNTLPSHPGYAQLRIILEKQGKYDEAIALCEQAKQQGWNDNWDKMIDTLKNKKEKTQ